MLSKITIINIAHIPSAVWKHAHSWSQLWLLVDMFVWNIIIRAIKPFLPIQRLVLLAAPHKIILDVSHQDVLRNLQWFDYFQISGSDGNCMIRALMLQRFLSIAGEKTNIFIGFSGNEGHAWVEISGKAIRESKDTQRKYKPTMVLKTGSRILVPFTQN